MDTDTMERKLRDLYSSGDVQELARQIPGLATEDLVQEWPQSGERIRGRDNVMAVNEGYEGATGTEPKLTLRRITRPGQAWIVEGTIDYGDGTPVSLVSILEPGPTARSRARPITSPTRSKRPSGDVNGWSRWTRSEAGIVPRIGGRS